MDIVERPAVYLIRRHGAFFRPDAAGYTTHIGAAGFYTRDEAEQYSNVEGVTISTLDQWRSEALAVIEGAARLSAALTPPLPLEGSSPLGEKPAPHPEGSSH